MKEKLQQIREAVIESNPEILKRGELCDVIHCSDSKGVNSNCNYVLRPIRLADVLSSVRRGDRYIFEELEEHRDFLYNLCGDTLVAWNTYKDDLNDQEESTINFLHSILCPNLK